MADFAWGSALGASVALWLAYGAFYLFIGTMTPLMMDRGIRPIVLFVSQAADTRYYGEDPEALMAREPAVRKLRSSVFLALAAIMCAAGLLVMAVAWFALRAAEPWALGALAGAGLVVLPFYVALFAPYVRVGAPIGFGHMQPFILVPGLLLVPAAVLGWVGLR